MLILYKTIILQRTLSDQQNVYWHRRKQLGLLHSFSKKYGWASLKNNEDHFLKNFAFCFFKKKCVCQEAFTSHENLKTAENINHPKITKKQAPLNKLVKINCNAGQS